MSDVRGESCERFAIMLRAGEYARLYGSDVEWVPLEKAKLWRTRGHVHAHLARFQTYPEGAVIVRVRIGVVGAISRVVDIMREQKEASAKRRAAADVRWAAVRVENAKAELERAMAAAGKAGT